MPLQARIASFIKVPRPGPSSAMVTGFGSSMDCHIIVREQAALIGHESTWRDDLAGVDADRRAEPAIVDPVPLAFRRGGRVLAACGDLCAVLLLSTAGALLLPVRWTVSAIVCALLYHTVSLVVLGSTPTVWAIDTHLALRHPSDRRAQKARLLRLPGGSEPHKA